MELVQNVERRFGWMFLLVGWLIAVTGGHPVVVEDVVMSGGREVGRSLRFRTTGRGNDAFKVIGRLLRRWGIDEWPGFWSVLRGDVRFAEVWRQAITKPGMKQMG